MSTNYKHYHIPYVHSYIKYYPNLTKLYVFNKPIRKAAKSNEPSKRRCNTDNSGYNPSINDSIRRTKTSISDYVLSNRFSMFVTFTFSPEKLDRTDETACRNKLTQWLKYQRTYNPNLKYLIVPEKHKDGSIHFHGLLENYTGEITPAINPKTNKQITRKGRTLYNLPSYRIGHSTLAIIATEDIQRVSTYIKKYITKELSTTHNKKRYWTSKNLIKPIKQTNPEISEQTFKQTIEPLAESYENDNLTIYTIPHNMQLLINKGINLWPKQQQPTKTKNILTSTQSLPKSKSSKLTRNPAQKTPATNLSG